MVGFELFHVVLTIEGFRLLYTPSCFRLCDALKLTLTPQVGLNSAKTPSISRKHLPEAVLCLSAARLLSGLHLGLERPNDALQIADRARQAIDAG